MFLLFFLIGGELDLCPIPVATLLINILFYSRMTHVHIFKLWTDLYSSSVWSAGEFRVGLHYSNLYKYWQCSWKNVIVVILHWRGRGTLMAPQALPDAFVYQTLYCNWGRWDWFLRSTMFDRFLKHMFIGCLLVNSRFLTSLLSVYSLETWSVSPKDYSLETCGPYLWVSVDLIQHSMLCLEWPSCGGSVWPNGWTSWCMYVL